MVMGERMFDVYCARHGCRVLLFTSDIRAIHNTPDGIEVHYTCYCGHRGIWCTGRRSRGTDARADRNTVPIEGTG